VFIRYTYVYHGKNIYYENKVYGSSLKEYMILVIYFFPLLIYLLNLIIFIIYNLKDRD